MCDSKACFIKTKEIPDIIIGRDFNDSSDTICLSFHHIKYYLSKRSSLADMSYAFKKQRTG